MAGNFKKQQDSLARTSMDLLINELFKKHGVKMSKPKLSAREKRELQNLVKDLKKNVENLTKNIEK
ncbi:hypothetical protein [Pseudobacillus wudalianchiensis]|uniref:Spore coat protein n=1 Tax=Pseudobacillus wudalianchiensis TaxID=1743143 RepID=A0A1B9B727_9BACI|nr:hypothetical protein [Bacillus wudalianchiensis]OCA91897.1 hypothetical protein A8F95_19440 [Bacillus wudalianchiensis]